MVLMEFLKKHKNALLIGFCFSTFLLSIALIILANVALLVLMGLITLLTPAGFAFALVGILLLGTMIGALLWAGLNYLVDNIKAWRAQRKESLFIPLTEEDKQTAWLDELSLSEDDTSDQTMVLLNKSDNQPDTLLSPEAGLAEFSKEANNLLARLSVTISSQEDITALSACFGTFKKAYYQLAKKYHPDKGMPDKEVWSTQQFQTLNAIYSNVKMSVDRKLENLSQKSADELLDEENQLLKELIKLLKKRLAWLKRAEQELASMKIALNNLDKDIAQDEEGTQLINEGLSRNEQGLARNAQGIAQIEQGITENAKLLEKNAKSRANLDALSSHTDKGLSILVDVVKDLVQEGQLTAPAGVDLKSFSFPPVDDEKNRDKKTSFPFN